MEFALETLTGLLNDVHASKKESLHQLDKINSRVDYFESNHRSVISMLKRNGAKVEMKEGDFQGKMYQTECLLQRKNSSCGYFALFNAIQLMMAATAQSEEDAEWHIRKFLDPSYFWLRYTQQINRIKRKCDVEQNRWYPWTTKDIEEGDNFHNILNNIEEDPWVAATRKCNSIGISVMPEFSSFSLRYNAYPVRTSKDLHQVFQEFGSRENYSRSFIIGQTNHWICVVINKFQGQFESILCDSRNHFVLNQNESALEQLAVELLTQGGRGLWKMKYVLTSLKDCSQSLTLLHRCALQELDIVKELLRINVTGFFETFQWYAGPLEGFDPSNPPLAKDGTPVPHDDLEWQEAVNRWLSDYFPPPVIEKNICGVLEALGWDQLDDSLRKLFRLWILLLRRRLNFRSAQTFQRLYRSLKWFDQHLPQ